MTGERTGLSDEGPFVHLEVDEPHAGSDVGEFLVHTGDDPDEGPCGWIAIFDDEDVDEIDLVREVLAEPPALPPRSHRDVAEVSARGRVTVVAGNAAEYDVLPADTTEWHRIRVSRRQSGVRPRLVVQAWPADPTPGQLLRGEEKEQVVAQWVLDLPEAAAGLKAASRIGAMLKFGPRNRLFSGEVGTVTVEAVLPGTPQELADIVSTNGTLIPVEPDNGLVTGPYLDDDDSHTWEKFKAEVAPHPDPILAPAATLLSRPHASHAPPNTLASWWRWAVFSFDVSTHGPHGIPLVPMLHRDTLRTVHLTPITPEQTAVRVVHEHVPIEWVDDLAPWWTLQLAIARHLQLGALGVEA